MTPALNVFVTGGAGYIGSAAAADLLAAGCAVTVFDKLSRGRRAAIPPCAGLRPGRSGFGPPVGAGGAARSRSADPQPQQLGRLLVRRVVEMTRQVTGPPIPARERPRRPGDASGPAASSEKSRRELGWAPRCSALEDIVLNAWEWHRTHPHGYEAKDEHG